MMDLKNRAIQSTAWYAATRLCTQALSWSVSLVLVRLLNPEDYGLFAIALAVISLLELFQEFGFGVAIIQRQNLGPRELNTIFWIVTIASAVIVAFSFLGAGFAASFYGEPRLVWIIRVLSATFLINSLGMVPHSLLTKEINFRQRSLAEASGVVLSVGFCLGLAYYGYGVWALVGGHLVRVVVRNAALAVFCGWIPGLDLSLSGIREMMGMGVRVAGSSAVGEISLFANTSIIARFLGGYDLGLYSVGASLGRMNPLHKFSTSVINQLSLPVFSKLQKDDHQLRNYFLKITKYLAVIGLPAQFGMAIVANDLVVVLLSEKWLPVVGMLQIFALGGVFSILPLPSTPMLTARGRADIVFKYTCISSVTVSVAYVIGTWFGIHGVMIAWFVTTILFRSILLWLSLREIGLSLRHYLTNISSFLVATGGMAVAVLSSQAMMGDHLSPLERLATNITLGAVVYAVLVIAIDKRFSLEVRSIIREMLVFSRA